MVSKKYQPRGYNILYEDRDLIVGSKEPGFLTVAALWEKEKTIHQNLNSYVRKGNSRSQKCVYVVHRLDQATSGVLMFAKTIEAQTYLKDHWKQFTKIYYAVVHGKFSAKEGMIESYLVEDENYVVSSTKDKTRGKLAQTKYSVVCENKNLSLLKIHLLTGKKNQIRVHMAEAGHPIVGDEKYNGKKDSREKLNTSKNLLLHAFSIEFTHPFRHQKMRIESPLPEAFSRQIDTSRVREAPSDIKKSNDD